MNGKMDELVRNSVRIVRNILGYSQSEFAFILGLEKAILANIEQHKIDIKKTIGIAYISVVLMEYEKLNPNTIEHKLLTLYIEDFKKELQKAVTPYQKMVQVDNAIVMGIKELEKQTNTQRLG